MQKKQSLRASKRDLVDVGSERKKRVLPVGQKVN